MGRSESTRTPFTILLVILAVGLIVIPLLPVAGFIRFILEFAVVLAMAVAVWRIRPGGVLLILSLAAAVVTGAEMVLSFVTPGARWVVLDHTALIVFVALVVVAITRNVWREREVTADTIVGGIAVYVLLGVAWAAAYQMLEASVPGSFEVVSGSGGHWGPWESAPGQYPRLFFFSFVTLTTLGYGDIVPASIPAAGLSSVQAVVGPLYLAVLISRLVSIHVASARRDQPGLKGPGAS
jgi:hypothetical protein